MTEWALAFNSCVLGRAVVVSVANGCPENLALIVAV
jgi:hypothetical protein